MEAPPVYRLEQVSQRLELSWRGLPRAFFGRVITPLVMLGLFAASIALLAHGYADVLPQGWWLEWDWLWRMGMVAALWLCFPAFLVGGFIFNSAGAWAYWSRLVFDGGSEAFEARRKGWLGLRGRRFALAGAELGEITVRIGTAEAGPIPCQLGFGVPHPDGDGWEWTEIDLAVEDVDRREEALDLTFRIARSLGRTRYQIQESGPRALQLGFPRPDEGRGDTKRVPGSSEPADYAAEMLAGVVSVPDREVERIRFDPQSPLGAQIAQWGPGQLIHFERPPPRLQTVVGLGLGAGLVLGLLVSFFMDDPPGTLAQRFGGLGVIGLAGAWFGLHLRSPARDVTLDWLRREVQWRGGLLRSTPDWPSLLLRWGPRRSASFDDVEDVVVRGEQRIQNSKHGNRTRRVWPEFRAIVELGIGRRRIPVAESAGWNQQPDPPSVETSPLGAALAQALQVPWRWVPYRLILADRLSGNAVGGIVFTCLFCAALAIAVFAGLVLEEGAAHDDAIVEMTMLGATIETTALQHRGWTIFDEGWLIKIDDPLFADEQARELASLLAENLQLVALDLSGTAISDEGGIALTEVEYLLWLDLRNTAVSDRFLANLGGAPLQYLDVRRTKVTDDGIAHLRCDTSPRFLLLEGPFTNDALPSLRECSNRRGLTIVSPLVTPDAVDDLQSWLPELEIDRKGQEGDWPPQP